MNKGGSITASGGQKKYFKKVLTNVLKCDTMNYQNKKRWKNGKQKSKCL